MNKFKKQNSYYYIGDEEVGDGKYESYKKRSDRNYKKRMRKWFKRLSTIVVVAIASVTLIYQVLYPYLSPAASSNGNLPDKRMSTDLYIEEFDEEEDDDIKGDADKVKTKKKMITKSPDEITVLVNKQIFLPDGYEPEDLLVPEVKFSFSGFHEKKQLRKEAAEALEDLFDATRKDGLDLYAVSGYRSYTRQYEIFTSNVRGDGLADTLKVSAMPGSSEHQTGLSMDVSTKSISNLLDESFAETPEGKWIAGNAHKYGYVVRYPKGKEKVTGYSYEPWHIRYVGTELATYLYENDLTLEEYYEFEIEPFYYEGITYNNMEMFGIDPEDLKVN